MPAPKGPVKYEEWRKKIGEASRRIWSDPNYKEKMRAIHHGKRLSDEHKAHISAALKGHPVSEETRRKISEAEKGKVIPREVREKISLATKQAMQRPEVKKRLSTAMKKIFMRPEVKQKHKLALTGRRLSESHRANISKGHKGLKKDPETVRRHAEMLKEKYAQPEMKQKLSQTQKLNCNRPEMKQKRSQRMKEFLAKMSEEERREYCARLAYLGYRSCKKERTSIELAIETVLQALNIPYEAQKKIGWYVVDFYLPNYNLIIECDGDYWHNLPGAQERDKRRDAYLRKQGYNILRLKEHEIKEDAEAALLNGLKVVR